MDESPDAKVMRDSRMKGLSIRLVSAVTAIAVGLGCSSASLAVESSVPIAAGDYAVEGSSCATVALAELMHYDGHNFSGAHASQCKSATRTHRGTRFTVATTCRALGDGTPARPDTRIERLAVISRTRFVSLPARVGQSAIIYVRCNAPIH